MSGIARDIKELIGNTPLYRFEGITTRSQGTILGKLEYTNPGKSIKDRVAQAMVERALKMGLIKEGGTLVEATCGNTGIALAVVSAAKGFNLILVMPEGVNEEKQVFLKTYGARLLFSPAEEGMKGALKKARDLLLENPSYYMPEQFSNPANSEIHRITTAKEILKGTKGRIDAFVAGVGTGGTITGVGEVLKEYNPMIHVVAVEPASSPVLSGGKPGPTKISGIGAGFVPPLLNKDIFDEVFTVEYQEAFNMTILLAQKEGILAGISSGANFVAARRLARKKGKGYVVVTILPDSGEYDFDLYRNLSRNR